MVVGAAVAVARLLDWIAVPGYSALMLAILAYGGLNLIALGVVGEYAWRGYENSKRRPSAVVARSMVSGIEPLPAARSTVGAGNPVSGDKADRRRPLRNEVYQ